MCDSFSSTLWWLDNYSFQLFMNAFQLTVKHVKVQNFIKKFLSKLLL